MDLLQSIDRALFNFGNQTLSNPVFDWLMPFLSGNRLFAPFVICAAIWLIWKYKARGVLCVLFCAIAVGIGDGWIINTLRKVVQRPRPFNDIETAITLVGRTGSFSLPSAHSANAFAISMVCLIYFRNSWKFMLPLAFGITYSRVYNGVHYPADTVMGAVMGAGYGLMFVWLARELWTWAGQKWFPLWWRKLPDLMNPDRCEDPVESSDRRLVDLHWLRSGYLLIALLFIFRLYYISAGKIELSEDEAYQWQWSQHLALSYFSKPPLIAYTQALGTGIWGDNAFGVRFFSPVISALLGLCLLRFLHREGYSRAGFWLIVILSVTVLTAVGSILMVIDSLSVAAWALAMICMWRAVETDSTKSWLGCGFWLGIGFLAKYTALFQLVSIALVLVLLPKARRQLVGKGLWLALGLLALSTVPVLVWNAQHDWITVTHLGSRAGLETKWIYNFNFMQDFIVGELALLNPVFCSAMIWAAFAFWKRYRGDDLMKFLFLMGAPLFVGYFLFTVRSRVQPNWIAPAIVPLFCLMVIYWDRRFQDGIGTVKRWLVAGVAIGMPLVILLHDTNIPSKLIGKTLPAKLDPLRRVRAWSGVGDLVSDERQKLKLEGPEVFLIGAHYGITSVLAFYIEEANRGVPDHPLVYYRTPEEPDHPENQYYFWPDYRDRKGENAIYVRYLKLNGEYDPVPVHIRGEFESVEDLGVKEVFYRGRLFHRLNLFVCRNKL